MEVGDVIDITLVLMRQRKQLAATKEEMLEEECPPIPKLLPRG